MHELLALEAINSLGSVQAAAEALHVTPSGVSHRIASLERRIGAALLQRQGRGVALTSLALDYVEAIRPSLADLAHSTRALRNNEHQVIRIASAPAVAVAWLLPCMQRFAQQRREARFHVTTVATPDEMPSDCWDVLIHYGGHPKRGSLRRILHAERLICVAAPGHERGARQRGDAPQAAAPKVLRLAPLFGATTKASTARRGVNDDAQLVFDDALTMLEAVAAGAGMAWCTETAASPFLASKRLVRVHEKSFEGDRYFFDLSEAGRFKPLAGEFFHRLADLLHG